MVRLFTLLIMLCGGMNLSAQPPGQDTASRKNQGERPAAQGPQGASIKLPQGISLGTPLSEDDAVAVALWNNAALQADLAAIGIAKADLLDAGLLRNPTLQMLLPFGYTQFEMLLNLPGEILWQRPKRVAAAKIEVERVARGLEQNGLDLVRDVRIAFADLILAGQRERLAGEAVQLRRQIAALTEARLRAGDISELEANTARLEVSTAEEQSARLAQGSTIAYGRLRHLLGLESEQLAFEIKMPQPAGGVSGRPAWSNSLKLEQLQEMALANRPDLGGAALAIEAAAGRAKWERSKLFSFAELLSIKRGAGLDFSPRGGFLMELPVFHRNKGGITRADMEVERAGKQYLAVHHRISQEVREAYAQVLQADEGLKLYSARIMPQAEEGVWLADKGYQSGSESYLFVLEATRKVLDARMRMVELVNELQRATVQLDRGIGRKHDVKN